jgi:chondroitin AC lyase
MQKHIVRTIIFMLLFTVSTRTSISAKETEDNVFNLIIQRIQASEWNKVTDVTVLDNTVASLSGALQANGSWPDVPYASTAQTNWEPITHLDRLKNLVLAYTLPNSSYFENVTLHAQISTALTYWYNQHPTSTNWFMQQIGCPQRVGIILILLRAGATPLDATLETSLLNRIKTEGGRPDQSGSQGTGANKIDIATHWVYRACLTENNADLSFGAQQVYYPIETTTATEGLKHDLSIMQHGPQFYTGGYGSSFAGNVANMAVFLRETSYAMTGEKLNLLTSFIRDSYIRIIRGKYFLYNVLGRGLTRPGALNQSALTDLLGKVKFLDPENATVYDDAIARLTETAPHAGSGLVQAHTHYFCADYTLYTSPAYTFDVRTVSTRTYRNENGNDENLKGYFLSDGATCISVDGDEYVDIFPAWDWTKIPGVTAPQKTSIPKPAQWGTFGKSVFAGGVSDSVYGVSAYALNDPDYNINTTAKKAWFFFGKEVVCLGAAIQSTASEMIQTTVNQCLLKGDITLSSNGATSTLTSAGSYAYNNTVDWILHNKIAYLFPQGGNLKLSNQVQTGNWSAINTSYSGSVSKNVFKLWFEHGIKPANINYAYIVLPNTDVNALENYNVDDIEILANTDSVQAVRHKILGIMEFVFYRAASYAEENFTLKTNKGCALILRDFETAAVRVQIADPSQSNAEIKLRFTSKVLTTEKELSCTMPAAPYKGASSAFTIDNNTPDYVAPAPQDLVYPVADAFVRGGLANQGATNPLEVKEDETDSYRRHSYLKFDLTDIDPDDIREVNLVLSIHSTDANVTATDWQFKRVEDDSWTETGIVWNNKPAPDSQVIQQLSGCAACDVIVDVTDVVINEIKHKNKLLTIHISSTKRGSDGKTFAKFYSREEADISKRPQLQIKKKSTNETGLDALSPEKNYLYAQDGYIRSINTDAPLQIYTIAGMPVSPDKQLSKGVYIVKSDNSVVKFLLK